MENGQHTHDLAPGGGSNGEPKIGRILEHKRKEKGLSLEAVEQATKIRKRYLDGLEREDYGVLPDGVYAQGFLKTYANYLGLDGEALSRQLKSRRKPRRERGINYNTEEPEREFEEPLISPTGLQGTEQRRFPTSAVVTLLVAVLVLAVVVGALYFVGRGVESTRSDGDTPPPEQPAERPAGKDQEQVASKQRAEAAAPPEDEVAKKGDNSDDDAGDDRQSVPPDTLQVRISVQDRPSWVFVRADGIPVYGQVVQPGFSETFEADRRVFIKGGDAGAVSVEINGQDAGTLGPAYTIDEKNFTLKSAS